MKNVTVAIAAISTALVLATSAGAMTAHPEFDIAREAALGEIGNANLGEINVVEAAGFINERSQALTTETTINTYKFASINGEVSPSEAGYGQTVR